MRSLPILLFILLTYRVSAQNPLSTSWNKTADLYLGEQDEGQTVFEMNNKMLVIGSLYSWAGNSWGVINSVWDTTGQLISKKVFLDTTYLSLSINKSISDGSHAVYGVGYAQKLNDSINDLDLYFVKYNALGDTVFTKIFKDTGTVIGYDIVRIKPNLFAVLGQTTPHYQNAVKFRTQIVLLDSLGNSVGQKFSPVSSNLPYFLCHDPANHEYYAIGTGYYNSGFIQAFDDSTLNLKYTKSNLIGISSFVNSAVFYKGSLYCTFSTEVWSPPVPFAGNQLQLYKFGLKNQVLSVKALYKIPPKDTAGNAGSANLVVDGDRILFAGFNSYTGLNMYFCDTMLNEICRARIEGPDSTSSFSYASTTLTRSKKLMSTGYSFDNGSTQGVSRVITWLSLSSMSYKKYVEDGCGNFTGLVQNNNEISCNVFPNPCNDILQIRSENSIEKQVFVSIIDILGHECIRNRIDLSSDYSLNVSQLQAGMYTILIEGDRRYWSGKLLKE